MTVALRVGMSGKVTGEAPMGSPNGRGEEGRVGERGGGGSPRGGIYSRQLNC